MGGGKGLGFGGTPSVTNTPQQITTDKWISFSTGVGISFAVKEDGTLWAWGRNSRGQLGDGTTTDRLVPTQIGTDTNWRTVQAKATDVSMATKTDGSVWYWGGTNYYGTYGNGNSYGTTYIITPTQTQGICVDPLTSSSSYTPSTIGAVTGTDNNGVGTTVGDSVKLTGVVHCQNFRTAGYDVALIDSVNDGITLFSPTDINGYVPTEGDKIEVEGEITQFNGLLQIKPESITVLQQGAALQSPTLTAVLDETTESQLVRIENLELVNGETTWPTNGNIEVTNQVDTFTVSISTASVLAGTPTPIINFHLTGIGKQFDMTSPYNDGYRVFPCSVEPYCDIDVSTTVDTGTVTVNATGFTYQWMDCADSSQIAGETGESFTPTTAGDYAVIITEGPCVDTSACVYVEVLGLAGNEMNKHFEIYPNPAKEIATVSYTLSSSKGELEVYDLSGRSIEEKFLTSTKGEVQINTSKYQAGVYIIVVRQSNGHTMQQKLVIE